MPCIWLHISNTCISITWQLCKHAERPGFFSCFTSGSCTLAKYTKLSTIWQLNIRNMLWAFGGGGFASLNPPPGVLRTSILPFTFTFSLQYAYTCVDQATCCTPQYLETCLMTACKVTWLVTCLTVSDNRIFHDGCFPRLGFRCTQHAQPYSAHKGPFTELILSST